MQMFDLEYQSQNSEHKQYNNSKTIVQIHSPVQNEEYLVVMVHIEFPNAILHDIITHKLGDSNWKDLEEDKVTKNFQSQSDDDLFLNNRGLS